MEFSYDKAHTHKTQHLMSDNNARSFPFNSQDANHIGITITEELPHNKEQCNQLKHKSNLETKGIAIPSSKSLEATVSSPENSLSLQPGLYPLLETSFDSRFNSKNSANWTQCNSFEQTKAFRKFDYQTKLPLSYQRRLRERKQNGYLYSLTVDLKTTYLACNTAFKYNEVNNPRRVLTKPSKPTKNDGYDNDDFDYILYVNDVLGGDEGHKYVVLDVLGAGTFGQVVKCRNTKTEEIVAIKIVKNNQAYRNQSMMEVAILQILNQRHDPNNQHHLLRLKDTFVHKRHLCLVFELLSDNLYELIKQNHFRGLSTNLVRVFTAQILDALTVLNEARIIHCDLKPENILLKNLESPTLKVIDFGSACHEAQTTYTYIQSRFYRSPEVLLGLPYTSAIDMWSLGCIAAELFLGLPLFPGNSEYNQMSRIIELLGPPPNYMIEVGKNSHRYFDRDSASSEGKRYVFKSITKYSAEQGKTEQPSKRYFTSKTLSELISSYPISKKTQMAQNDMDKENYSRLAFIDFLQGLLRLNPIERWSPQQAKQHPFITGQRADFPFQPPYIPRKQLYTLSFDSQQNKKMPYNSSNNTIPQPTLSDPYLSSNCLSLPSPKTHPSKRGTYIPPLPSVLEPPHDSFDRPQSREIPGNLTNFGLSNTCLENNGFGAPQINNAGTIGNGRPRANTVGTMQVPLQIQWASIDNGTQLYSPYYPYGQREQTDMFSGYGSFNGDVLPRWKGDNGSQTVDLERDGDWQEDTPHKRRFEHKRSSSNSSMFPSIQPSVSSSLNGSQARSSVASLHRLMRGNSYNKQEDIEWDGIIHHSSSSNQQQKSRESSDSKQSLKEKWNPDPFGRTAV